MAVSIDQVRNHLQGPEGTKMLRYSATSLISLAVSVVCLAIFNGPLGMKAWVASTLATAIAAIPSYYLNRRWAWGKSGKSHLWKELAPFWALAFIGWGFSTFSVHVMENYAIGHHFSHLAKTGSVTFVYVAAFGVLWVAKFVIFNKILFVHTEHDLDSIQGGLVGGP